MKTGAGVPAVGPNDDDALPLDIADEAVDRSFPGKSRSSQQAIVLANGSAPDNKLSAGPRDDSILDKETFLPVLGQVRLTQRELDVFSHPAVQRLFEFRQLGQANLVFRGATHMRGEHAIGTLGMAAKFVDAIARSNRGRSNASGINYELSHPLTPEEVAFVRLAALLHDVGHLPTGHTLEDELGLLDAHDEDERIDRVLNKTTWHGLVRETLAARLDRLYAVDALATGLLDSADRPLPASGVVKRIVSKDYAKPDSVTQDSTRSSDFRIFVLRDIVGNTLCADLLDYLHRDWFHIGRPRYFDERLLDYVEIRSRKDPRASDHEHQLVINLGTPHKPRHDAISMMVDLLESRYQLCEVVLFHRTKLVAASMLERSLAEYHDSFDDSGKIAAMQEVEETLLMCTDGEAYSRLADLIARRAGSKAVRSPELRERLQSAEELMRRLRIRELHKEFATHWADDIPASAVQKLYAPVGKDRKARSEAARRRLLAVRTLEEDLGLKPCSIVMYCPPGKMNSKIAEAKVWYQQDVRTLANVDIKTSAGTLNALNERFSKLWRVSLAMDREVYTKLTTTQLSAARELVVHGVLGKAPDRCEPEEKLREIAERMRGVRVGVAERRIASANNDTTLSYPTGFPSVRSIIADGSLG